MKTLHIYTIFSININYLNTLTHIQILVIMSQTIAPLTKSTIFDYTMNVLDNFGEGWGEQYVRFDSRKEKESFIKYMFECYENYKKYTTTTDIQEKEKYENQYKYYYDDELSELLETNTNTDTNNQRQMELCLFYDATKCNRGGTFYMDEIDSKNHWLVRIGDCGADSNFKKAARFNTWGMKRASAVKGFELLVKKGDILWFIPGGTDGYVLACAEYVSSRELDYATRRQRYTELGLIQNNISSDWDVFIDYINLTYTNPTTKSVGNTLEDRNRCCTQIKGNSVNVRKYNKEKEKCKIDLPKLYSEIVDARRTIYTPTLL